MTGTQSHTDVNSYAYVLLPEADVEDAQDYLSDRPIKIKQQDARAHVIVHQDEKIIAANIWQKGEVKLLPKFKALDPMAIMIKNKHRQLEIAISDPTQKQSLLRLVVPKDVRIVDDSENRLHISDTGILLIHLDGLKGETYTFKIRE